MENMRKVERFPLSRIFAAALLAFALSIGAGFAFAGTARAGDMMTTGLSTQAESLNVTAHSKAEIIARLKNNAAALGNPVTYTTQPVLNTTAGELSSETKTSALKMLNNIRYVAGLDDVDLNETYGAKAQAAAFVDNAISCLTHTPSADGYAKPSGMSDDLWSLGNEGASSANIACGHATLNSAVLDWMSDADAGNIDRVGHRRWCLNPEMSATGFGASGRYYAMYAFDSGSSSTKSKVAWPAQIMPVEFFDNCDPWTLSMGESITDTSAVKVVLTRTNDGKSWTFSTLSGSAPGNMTDAYFNINNGWYGQQGCIIFRPADISYQAGDKFHVSITGVNGRDIDYNVEFIAGYPVESLSFAQDSYILKYNGTSIAPSVTPADAQSYEVTWKSSDSSIVSVSADGVMTMGNPGSATLTATISGAYTATGASISKSVTVTVPKEITTSTCTISFTNLEYTGAPVQPQATIVDKDTKKVLEEGVDYVLDPSEDIVNVGDSTYVWVIGKGAYGTSSYYGYPVTVKPRTIDSSMASITKKTFTYNGKARTQTVSVKLGGKTLAVGTDYDVTYANNVNAGTATVVVAGKGNFGGSVSANFTIKPATVTAVTLSESSLIYNGKEQEPSVATVSAGSLALGEGDYSVVYESNKNVGTATVTVKGEGNFTGSAGATFTITKAKNPLTVKAVAKTVKLAKGKTKLAKAKVLKGAVKITKKGKGTVTYTRVAKGSSKRLTVNKKTGKITVKKGTKRGTYKIKVKVRAAGNANYKAKTKTVTVKVVVK